jgi:hypothetical protein
LLDRPARSFGQITERGDLAPFELPRGSVVRHAGLREVRPDPVDFSLQGADGVLWWNAEVPVAAVL